MDKPMQLSENFYINNKKKSNVKIQVKLDENGVYLRRETEEEGHINEQLIRIEDIVGSRCGPLINKRTRGGLNSCRRLTEEEVNEAVGASQKDTSAYLYVYAYVKKEKPLRRDRTVRILRFRTHDIYEENLKIAESWNFAIKINKNLKHTDNIVRYSDNNTDMDQRQLLILLNPKSGSGKGRELFQKQVAPVLNETDIQYDLHVTKYANFAREFVRTRQDLLERYRGIVVAAGDGLFYEVLNGIMEREDWRRICQQMPLGIIPCGSGNGLAKSITHLYGEPYEPKPIISCTLSCVNGNSTPMDVVRVEVVHDGKQTQMYSFLSVGWGLIADIDIGSERLRSIGAQRFIIWSIHRVISLRTYKGKLYYLPWKKEQVAQSMRRRSSKTTTATGASTPNENGLVPKRFSITKNEFRDALDIPEGDEQTDNFTDVISLDRQSIRPHTDSWHSATSNRTVYYSMGGQSIRSQRSMASRIEAANTSYSQQPLVPTIPTLNMPLPLDTWRCIDGEFVMVHAAYTTHLASDCLFAPDSRLNDGIIYLIIIRAGVGRSQLVQFLMSLSSGTHLPEQDNEYIQVLPVSAFRIEPSSESEGIMAVDGERVDYGAIQGEIFPGLIRVMVP